MARYGVVADIHGNREALAAALAALESRGVEKILCLGDVVGYKADPDECVAMLRAKRAQCIAGNHDLISLHRLDFSRCSLKAMYSLQRTRRMLSPASAEFLATLPDRLLLEKSIALVHGGVRDVQQYMKAASHIEENAAYLREDFPAARICFFGHSHEQRVWEVAGGTAHAVAAEGRTVLRFPSLYFVNPGSVDAARKREHKLAECAIFDSDAWTIEFLRVQYDAAAAELKAAMFGYRMGPLTARVLDLRRRVAAKAALLGRLLTGSRARA
ncbi:MAG: metallophosphoesterase family protein [Betaproteobacteria bacterium]